jgi:hypothetical protein
MVQDMLQLLDSRLPNSLTRQAFAPFPFAMAWIDGVEPARKLAGTFPLSPSVRLDPWEWTGDEIRELVEFNLGAGNASGAGLAAQLRLPQSRTVVTGQQPTLFAAPLYNWAKAVGVIQRAREVQALEPGRPVIPVFWIASDDNDFDELRDFRLPDRARIWHRLGQLVSRGHGKCPGSPAWHWTLDREDRQRFLDAAAQVLQGLPGQQAAWEWLADIWPETPVDPPTAGQPSDYERMFVRAMVSSLPNDPILFVVPRLRGLRRAAQAVLIRDLEIAEVVIREAEEAGRTMARKGWGQPLTRPEHALNFFLEHQGQRLALRRDGEEALAVAPGVTQPVLRMTLADLRKRLEESPDLFSPGVLTRPVVQDRALRPVEYLAGPGELAYLAQIHQASLSYGVVRSPISLRPTVSPSGEGLLTLPSFSTAEEQLLRDIENLRGTAERVLAPRRGGGMEAGEEGTKTLHLNRAIAKTLRTMDTALSRLLVRVHRQAGRAQSQPGSSRSEQTLAGDWLWSERRENWATLLARGETK